MKLRTGTAVVPTTDSEKSAYKVWLSEQTPPVLKCVYDEQTNVLTAQIDFHLPEAPFKKERMGKVSTDKETGKITDNSNVVTSIQYLIGILEATDITFQLPDGNVIGVLDGTNDETGGNQVTLSAKLSSVEKVTEDTGTGVAGTDNSEEEDS